MALTGTFSEYTSPVRIGLKCYSFELRNTSLFSAETVNLAFGNEAMGTLQLRQGVTIKARQSMTFNQDNMGWTWFQHDFVAIVDGKGAIKQKWTLNIPEHALGMCPDCHGSHGCRHCNPQYGARRLGMSIQCPYCGGTGICMTCYVPRRQGQSAVAASTIDGDPYGFDREAEETKRRKIQAYRDMIRKYESELEDVRWEINGMRFNNQTLSLKTSYQCALRRKADLERLIDHYHELIRQLS